MFWSSIKVLFIFFFIALLVVAMGESKVITVAKVLFLTVLFMGILPTASGWIADILPCGQGSKKMVARILFFAGTAVCLKIAGFLFP